MAADLLVNKYISQVSKSCFVSDNSCKTDLLLPVKEAEANCAINRLSDYFDRDIFGPVGCFQEIMDVFNI